MADPGRTAADEQALAQYQDFVLSHLPPGAAQQRLALGIVLVLAMVCLLIAFGPLSGVEPYRIDAFVPAYTTAMIVCDSITAVLLFAQFSVVRSRAILVIARAYLFTALMVLFWFLTFPGVFGPASLMGGLQSTVFLWLAWHCAFPLFVIRYALTKEKPAATIPVAHQGVRGPIVESIAGTMALAAVAVFVCIAAEPLLPRLMLDAARLGPLWPYVGIPVGMLTIAALVLLWMRRRSMLDLWLMVVMCIYVMEIPLSYYPTPIRFSVAWYTLRVVGILSSSLVLIVLLYEIQTLYGRLLWAVLAQRRERTARLLTGDAVAATIAHEVRQPLTAMVTTADAGLRFLERAVPNLGRAKEAFEQIAADGHRAGAVVANIRATFKHDAQNRTSLDIKELIQETLTVQRENLREHQILVHTDASEKLPAVHGDRIQLQQVLLNLITNAIDSMATKDQPRVLRVTSEANENRAIVVSVADTGAGIGSQEAQRIFDPLFTTKSGGMGMGLAICRGIIEAHEGRLWFSPNIPQGAVFHFSLHSSAPAIA